MRNNAHSQYKLYFAVTHYINTFIIYYHNVPSASKSTEIHLRSSKERYTRRKRVHHNLLVPCTSCNINNSRMQLLVRYGESRTESVYMEHKSFMQCDVLRSCRNVHYKPHVINSAKYIKIRV